VGCRALQTEIAPPDYWVPENFPNTYVKCCIGVLQPEKPGEVVGSIALSKDGCILFNGLSDKNVCAWDLKNKSLLWKTKTSSAQNCDAQLSPNGNLLATASQDNNIYIWNTATGTELNRIEGHANLIWSLSFSPNGQHLASCSHGTIRIWDIKTGKELRQFIVKCFKFGHKETVMSISFNSDGTLLAAGLADSTICIFDVETGKELKRLLTNDDLSINNVLSVSFSPNGQLLASGSTDSIIRVWDLKKETELYRLKKHTRKVCSISFSSDGCRLSSISQDKTIRIWDTETGTELQRFSYPEKNGWRLAWAPSGAFLVSSNSNDTVRIWDTRTTEMQKSSSAPRSIKPERSRRKQPAHLLLLPKTWSILHRMNIDLPLSLIADINALLSNEQPDSLKPLSVHPIIRKLVTLRWPKPDRTALIALLLQGFDCGPEWRPPKDIDSFTLRNKLIDALSGESCPPESPNPPLEFLKVAANNLDNRMITLLRALGPKAVASNPGLPFLL
ncbi:MAG: WD40 repeat-containing protein, partial [Candidatus Magnetoglobus multicellularis str. Araruama]